MRPSSIMELLHGSCACGAVTYEVDDAFEYALSCHCSNCRAATGSAFKPFGGIPVAALRLTAGEDALLRLGGDDHDLRCRRCGSLLYSVVRAGTYVHVAYGSLRDEPSLAPEGHIYVASKASWETIADGLPQWDELP